MVIKRVGPVSCAKITGMLYAIIGVIIGLIVFLASLAGGFFSGSREGAALGAGLGMAAIVVLPILYGGLGFVVTLIMAGLYNLMARLVGGVQMDVE